MNTNWIKISQRSLKKDFIIKHKDKLNWFFVVRNSKLPIDVIVACAEYIDFDDLLNFGEPIFNKYKHDEETLRIIFDLAPKDVKLVNTTAWGKKLNKEFVREHIERFNFPLGFVKEELNYKLVSEWDYMYIGYHEYVFTQALFKPHPMSYTKKYVRYYDYATLTNKKYKDELDQLLSKEEQKYLRKMKKVICHG